MILKTHLFCKEELQFPTRGILINPDPQITSLTKLSIFLSLLEVHACFLMLNPYQPYILNDYLERNNSDTIAKVCSSGIIGIGMLY